MSVDLFPNVNRSKVEKLPFLKGTFPFVYNNHKGKTKLGIVYEVDNANYNKITDLLYGKITKTIGTKDRVFVLSGCKVPQFKIKDYCKKVGAIMTGDVTDATIVVGNNGVSQEMQKYNYDLFGSKTMVFEMDGYTTHSVESEKVEFDLILGDYFPDFDQIKQFLMTKAAAAFVNGTSVRTGCYITPYAATVLYEILSRKLPTISDDCLMEQLPTAIKLDREVCEQLTAMMASKDEENHKTAHEILANCDYSDSEFYLYTIARQFWSQLGRSRYKNVRLFYKEAKINELAETDEEDYIEKRFENETLTKEELELLIPIIAKSMNDRSTYLRSNLFKIKMELRPEYEKILGEHKFNKELNYKQNTDDEEL